MIFNNFPITKNLSDDKIIFIKSILCSYRAANTHSNVRWRKKKFTQKKNFSSTKRERASKDVYPKCCPRHINFLLYFIQCTISTIESSSAPASSPPLKSVSLPLPPSLMIKFSYRFLSLFRTKVRRRNAKPKKLRRGKNELCRIKKKLDRTGP